MRTKFLYSTTIQYANLVAILDRRQSVSDDKRRPGLLLLEIIKRDFATLTARFVDERGGELKRETLGPVTLQDRMREIGGSSEELTGLLLREASGRVPAGTRIVEIVLTTEVGSGGCDGYADNLSFVVTMDR